MMSLCVAGGRTTAVLEVGILTFAARITRQQPRLPGCTTGLPPTDIPSSFSACLSLSNTMSTYYYVQYYNMPQIGSYGAEIWYGVLVLFSDLQQLKNIYWHCEIS